MKPAKMSSNIIEPDCWAKLSWGEYYREAIEQKLKPWFAKMQGFHLLKIGNLSEEINSENCTISHQINVSLRGQSKQIIADPLYLPFAAKSIDACLILHTIQWCNNPQRLLKEVDKVLTDDGWLVLSSFNPLSLIGLLKLTSILCEHSPYNSHMLTITHQLNLLSLLNFEVLCYTCFHVLPWMQEGGKLLNAYFSALGCLQLIIARKRTIPLIPNFKKQNKINSNLVTGLIKALPDDKKSRFWFIA